MARIEVPMSPAAQRGSDWESASARTSPGGISSSDFAVKHTSAGPAHLSPDQFSSVKPAGMAANMESYYSTGAFPKATTDFLKNRSGTIAGNELKKSMVSSHSAGMSNMWSSSNNSSPKPVSMQKSQSSGGGKLRGIAGKIGSKLSGSTGKGRV